MLLDTHNPYKPSIIDWPELDPEARDRLVSLPIWDIAVQTEGKARLRVLSYAELIEDPLLQRGDRARRLRGRTPQGGAFQSRPGLRHPLGPEPEYLPPARSGMGLHGDRLQRVHRQLLCLRPVRAGQALRVSSRRPWSTPSSRSCRRKAATSSSLSIGWPGTGATCRWWRRPLFSAKILGVWVFLVWERIGTSGAGDGRGKAQDNNFTLTGSKSVGVDVCRRADRCLPGGERSPPFRL